MLRAGRWGHRPMGRRGRPPSRVNGASREHFLRQAHRSFSSEEAHEDQEEEDDDEPPVPMTTRLRKQAEREREREREQERQQEEQRMTETISVSDGEEEEEEDEEEGEDVRLSVSVERGTSVFLYQLPARRSGRSPGVSLPGNRWTGSAAPHRGPPGQHHEP
ncbi:hypothetical protein E3U43_002468 [Larimichthys crocea]|uniref:Uncharacterized protein n=1 Tax=Larimichthys crocea TaxID=215358 RepID=A0ACD3QRS9_LARCR|nr:hypothetical protein E3U43_002468 [Larimichthys crocea]